MKKNIKKFLPIYLFLLLLIVLEVIFWLNKNDFSLGYGILTYYILFPLCALIISIIYGRKTDNNKKYLLVLLFGSTTMFFQYTTYSLANMISFNKINLPYISMFLLYGFISLIGIIIGNCLKKGK